MKRKFKSDDKQYPQYQPNEQPSLISDRLICNAMATENISDVPSRTHRQLSV